MRHMFVINDFHVGSFFSICSPTVKIDLKDDNGHDYAVNYQAQDIQVSLFEQYLAMIHNLEPIDILVINGDMTEGLNPKGRSEGLWTSSMRAQVKEVVNLLKKLPIKEGTDIYITYSSGYHTGHNPSSDEMLMQELKLQGFRNVSLAYDWPLEIDGHRFHICHSIGVAMNKTTSLTKEITWAMENVKDYGEVEGIIRAHCHYASYVYRDGHHAWIVPGWKARDEFVASKGLRYNPKIGALSVFIDGRKEPIRHHLYEYSLIYPLDWKVV